MSTGTQPVEESVIRELNRRRVVRVMVAYVSLCFAALSLAHLVLAHIVAGPEWGFLPRLSPRPARLRKPSLRPSARSSTAL